MTLSVSEFFYSIQGESTATGLPFAFIRFSGCNLRCTYCDTKYAHTEGKPYSAEAAARRLLAFNCPNVLLTGGEPLLQEDIGELISLLHKEKIRIFIETNGTLPVSDLNLDQIYKIILDVKAPGSMEHEKFLWQNLDALRPEDELKFVLTDRRDFDWSIEVVKKKKLLGRYEIIFSPAFGGLSPAKLAGWILDSHMQIRLGLQFHKIIWPHRDRGV